MEDSVSYKASRSGSQEISWLLWKQNVNFHVHKSPPRVHILSYMKQFHLILYLMTFQMIDSNLLWSVGQYLPDYRRTIPYYICFLKTSVNTILLSIYRPLKCLFLLDLLPEYCMHFLYIPCVPLAPTLWFDSPNNIWWPVITYYEAVRYAFLSILLSLLPLKPTFLL
jgi:hypothetical protein